MRAASEAAGGAATEAPQYVFQSEFLREHQEVAPREQAGRLVRILGEGTEGDPRKDGTSVSDGVGTMQLFLGGPGSGAPMHLHRLAVNVLAFGRKRWFLRHPTHASYSATPASVWVRSAEFEPDGMVSCVQEAGDVLVVPSGWSHATINLEEAVGVAHEMTFGAEARLSLGRERAGRGLGGGLGPLSVMFGVPGSGYYDWHADWFD